MTDKMAAQKEHNPLIVNAPGANSGDSIGIIDDRHPENKLVDSNIGPDTTRVVDDTVGVDDDVVEDVDKDEDYSVGFGDVLTLVFTGKSLVSYLLDVGTDIQLTVEYKHKGLIGYFWATLACIVFPHVLLAITDLSMLWEDRKIMREYIKQQQQQQEEEQEAEADNVQIEMTQVGEEKYKEEADQNTETVPLKDSAGHSKVCCLLDCCVSVEFTKDTKLYAFRIILGLLGLGVIVRKLQCLYYKFKVKSECRIAWKQWYEAKMLEAERDSSNLAFICAFTENCPQSLLQLYIFVQNPVPIYESIGRSIITSVINLPMGYASYYRATRRQPKDDGSDTIRKDMDDVAFLFFYLGLLGAIIARVVPIGLFMGTVSYQYGFVVLAVHFLGHVIFIHFYQKPAFSGLAIGENTCSTYFSVTVQTLLYALVNLFLFVDLNDRTRKRWRIVTNNVVLYVENLSLLILSLVLVTNEYSTIYTLVFGLGSLMHLIFLSNYYGFMHPTVGICFNCGDEPEAEITFSDKNVESEAGHAIVCLNTDSTERTAAPDIADSSV